MSSYQPNSSRQQRGHHALLDLPHLGQFPFERGEFGIHVAHDFGSGVIAVVQCTRVGCENALKSELQK